MFTHQNTSPLRPWVRGLACVATVGVMLGRAYAAEPAPQRRVALVIGNARYAEVGTLRNPENDAKDMCASLKQLGFEAQCLYDIGSRRDFKEAINRFTASLDKGSAGLFYYAGHGLQVDGENYLVPTKALLKARADIEDESLNLKYLMAELDHVGNGFNIVILDACRNNPWSKSFRAVGRGLAATTDTPVGTVVVYATAANDFAQDGTGRNGVFTRSLLSYMVQPGLTIEDVIKRVTIEVQQDSLSTSGMKQTPFVYSSFTGNFCFAGCRVASSDQDLKAARDKAAALERQLEDMTRRAAPNTAPNTSTRQLPATAPLTPYVPPAF